MKKLIVVVLIVGLMVGCSNQITDKDIKKVESAMHTIFSFNSIEENMVYVFRDLKTLNTLVKEHGYESRSELKEDFLHGYKISGIVPRFKKNVQEHYRLDTINVEKASKDTIKGTIVYMYEGDKSYEEKIFKKNSKGQWYTVGDLEKANSFLSQNKLLFKKVD